jgi:hypothetical protein
MFFTWLFFPLKPKATKNDITIGTTRGSSHERPRCTEKGWTALEQDSHVASPSVICSTYFNIARLVTFHWNAVLWSTYDFINPES